MADFNTFKNNWLGKRVDYDHAYAFQCVDLVRQYFYENFGLGDAAGGVPYAISYWNDTPQGILNKFDHIEGSNAREGDVVILQTFGHNDYTPPGHIGIATGNINDSNVEILEQNGSTGGGSGIGPDAIRTRYVERSRVAGLLRPKNPNATEDQVRQAYRDMLEREADQGGLDHYVGHYMIDFVRSDLYNSAEHATLLARKEAARVAAEQAAQAATEAAKQPVSHIGDYVYEKLATPLDLVTNKDANLWNLDFYDYQSISSNGVLSSGSSFRAYGKAIRPNLSDNPTYFMREEDFGQADVTGAPTTAQGIRTVDLSAPAAPDESIPAETPEKGEVIPVTVTPSDPNKWKQSFNTLAAGLYKAKDNAVIQDAELKLANIEMFKGQNVPIAGSFAIKDGTQFYRTKKGLQNDTWYKVPLDLVERISLDEIFNEDDSAFDLEDLKLADEARKALEHSSIRKAIMSIIAYIEAKWLHKNKQNK